MIFKKQITTHSFPFHTDILEKRALDCQENNLIAGRFRSFKKILYFFSYWYLLMGKNVIE